MKAFDELVLVNYCHPDCIPLLNIMRLPKAEAFLLAQKLAEEHPNTTAFYRFADFENYYELRKAQDSYLYRRFLDLGGLPEEKHPLSFVLEGSEYLSEWFGKGVKTALKLNQIAPCHVSFTIGDSGAVFQKNRGLELLTVQSLREIYNDRDGDFRTLLHRAGCHYIEAQLWSDQYMKTAAAKPPCYT